METGLRLAGTVELASIDAPPDYGRADAILARGHEMFPGLRPAGVSRWMGRRPSLPDGLPVIGPAPGYRNVHLAFGHAHTGMIGAPNTGRIVAGLVAGQPMNVDITPFRARTIHALTLDSVNATAREADHGTRSSLRHPVRTGADRAEDRQEPVLSARSLQRHGPYPSARAGAHARRSRPKAGGRSSTPSTVGSPPPPRCFPSRCSPCGTSATCRCSPKAAEAVHEHGGLFGVQLSYSGGYHSNRLSPRGAGRARLAPGARARPVAGTGDGAVRHQADPPVVAQLRSNAP